MTLTHQRLPEFIKIYRLLLTPCRYSLKMLCFCFNIDMQISQAYLWHIVRLKEVLKQKQSFGHFLLTESVLGERLW